MAEGQNNTNTELIKAINALSQACSTLTTQIKSVDSTVQASTKATEDNTDSQEKSTDITKKTVKNFEQGSKSDQIILTMSEMLSKAGIRSEKTQKEMNEYLKTNLKTKGICVEFKEVNDQTILKGLIKPYPFPVVFDIHLDNKNILEQGADNKC